MKVEVCPLGATPTLPAGTFTVLQTATPSRKETHMRQCLVCGGAFTSPSHRGRPPETCSPECLSKRKSEQRRETKDRAIARGCPDDMHGTQTGATHYECHCVKCRMWWRDYQRARRAARKAAAVTH